MRAPLLFVALAIASLALTPQAPLVLGLDHVPVAVNDLEAAADRYRQLGFALKPGTPHANGIRNWHAKFEDGTEIELITAPKAVDSLTRKYRDHLKAGDGPAFLALFAPSRAAEATKITAGRLPYLFFGPRQASPTDRPEHFAHPNTAYALTEVWLAAGDFTAERDVFAALGARLEGATVALPEPASATVARFAQGTIVLLPRRFQRVPGRRIVGISVAVRDLDAAARALGGRARAVTGRNSLVVGPEDALGYWLELRPGRNLRP